MVNNNYLSSFQRNDYQKDNFDSFLKHQKFSFDIPAIHIAGTNGKGSVTSYLSSIYKYNGYKVGKFISPALFNLNEMICINDEPISDEDFLKLFNAYEKMFNKFDLSSFEILTYIAYVYFLQNHCDICVIECGMGGEIDATNVINPILSIITSISLEHTEYLGHTISEIALQKCGIIKEKTPVLIDDFEEDAVATIIKEAKIKEAPVTYIKRHLEISLKQEGVVVNYFPYGDVQLSSYAIYSAHDVSFAIEATLLLNNRFPVQKDKVLEGIKSVKMPCRFEIVKENPLVILDGAHNPEAAKSTCEAINTFIHRPVHVIFACFKDKNLGSLLSHFGSLGDDLTLTSFPHARARTKEEYFLFLGDYQYEEDCLNLLKQKMEKFPDEAILVTGSLAFVAYIKEKVFNHE